MEVIETILVSPQGLTPALSEMLDRACQRANLRRVNWEQSGGRAWPKANTPVLAVGVLSAGAREISNDLNWTVSQLYPGLPLLLLCQEPLTRDVVVLNEGRVTLLGQPLNDDKLIDCMLELLQHTPTLVPGVAPGQRVQTWQGQRWWAGAISYVNPGEKEAVDRQVVFPFVTSGRTGQTLAAVQFSRWQDCLPPDRLRNWIGEVGAGGGGMELAATAAALVVDPDQDRWTVTCPSIGPGAWLFSSQRVPTLWALSGHDKPARRTLVADAGDVILLHSAPGASPWPQGPLLQPDSVREIQAAAAQGGATLLRWFQRALLGMDAEFAAVVVEVW